MKYGFFTTYKHTIFLRQDEINGEPRLYYSNPIPHNAISSKRNVSIRECMFYLVHATANGDYQFKNKLPLSEWVHEQKPTGTQNPATPYKSPMRNYSDMVIGQRWGHDHLPDIGNLSLASNPSAMPPLRVQYDAIGHYIELDGRRIDVELPRERPTRERPTEQLSTQRSLQRIPGNSGGQPSLPEAALYSRGQDIGSGRRAPQSTGRPEPTSSPVSSRTRKGKQKSSEDDPKR